MSERSHLSNKPNGYDKHPDYKVRLEPSPKRLRVRLNGETVVDSLNARLLFETKHVPVYYFPRQDVRFDLLERTEHSTFCPFKGDASYWSIRAGNHVAENAVWTYEQPFSQVPDLKDLVAFYWNRMDQWLEEDEEVFVHARSPYVRVDILASSRPVRVAIDGQTVAASERARLLFETGLPTRYYIPPEDVDSSILRASDHETSCPYKGDARYWHVKVGERLIENAIWYYPAPVAEAAKIKDLLCFYPDKVDEIAVG